MNNKNELTQLQSAQFARLQAMAMSFICIMLCLFAAAAATRIPFYLSVADYTRLIGVILFGLLGIGGAIDNIRTHACLQQLRNE